MQHKNKPKKELKLKSEYEEPKMEILKILTLHKDLPNLTQVSLGYKSKSNKTALRKGIRIQYYNVNREIQAVS
jgi:hypothetical protein